MINHEEEWLARFVRFWSDPQSHFELLRTLFAENIKQIAPGLPTVRGLRRALMLFEKTFQEMPDLRATVIRHAISGDALFIEMTFTATVAGKIITWDNVDRFFLAEGKALERRAYFDSADLKKHLAS